MGSEKSDKTSRTRRAGLKFPIHVVRRQIKAKMGPKRTLQKGVEVIYAAVSEYVIERLLACAADRIKKGSYIDSTHLHAAIVDPDSEITNIFPKHATGLY